MATTFMTIKQANEYTGLSQTYIRNGCRNGTIPHLKVGARGGTKYMVDVQGLVDIARAQAQEMWKGVD